MSDVEVCTIGTLVVGIGRDPGVGVQRPVAWAGAFDGNLLPALGAGLIGQEAPIAHARTIRPTY